MPGFDGIPQRVSQKGQNESRENPAEDPRHKLWWSVYFVSIRPAKDTDNRHDSLSSVSEYVMKFFPASQNFMFFSREQTHTNLFFLRNFWKPQPKKRFLSKYAFF